MSRSNFIGAGGPGERNFVTTAEVEDVLIAEGTLPRRRVPVRKYTQTLDLAKVKGRVISKGKRDDNTAREPASPSVELPGKARGRKANGR